MFKKLFLLIAVVCAEGLSLPGQVTMWTISGRVLDGSAGVLPGVTVAIGTTETDSGRIVATEGRGYYTAPNLSLGQYEITACL